jgi:hypothetical protein
MPPAVLILLPPLMPHHVGEPLSSPPRPTSFPSRPCARRVDLVADEPLLRWSQLRHCASSGRSHRVPRRIVRVERADSFATPGSWTKPLGQPGRPPLALQAR